MSVADGNRMLGQALLLAVAVASIVAFALCGVDKHKATRGSRRIREGALLSWSLLGGSPGLLVGMLLFRHKIRKPSFLVRFLLVTLLQLGIVLVVLFWS